MASGSSYVNVMQEQIEMLSLGYYKNQQTLSVLELRADPGGTGVVTRVV